MSGLQGWMLLLLQYSLAGSGLALVPEMGVKGMLPLLYGFWHGEGD